jgi:hypothetical protein
MSAIDESGRSSPASRKPVIELYIEALLVDEELADTVWEAWDARVITNDQAAHSWTILANKGP